MIDAVPGEQVCLTEPMAVQAGEGTRRTWSLGGRRAKLALAVLVLERRRAVPREELAEMLWGEELPRSWEPSLREVLSKVRRALDAAPSPVGTVLHEAGCYRFHETPGLVVDVEAAEDDVRAADAALGEDPSRAAELARRAVAVAERPLLPGESGPWALARQDELRDVHLRALEALASAHLALGEHRQAAGAAQTAAALDPLRETAHVLRMAAAAAAGDRARAIDLHDDFRRRILDELGVPPSAGTQAAYLKIIEDQPAIAPSPAPAAPAAPAAAVAEPERAVRTILFCDLVGSTELVAGMGDRRWRELLGRHEALVRACADEHRLRLVKLIGDGALLVGESPSDAIAAARALCRRAPEDLDVGLRAGVHTGECELVGDDVAGIAVHVGARVCALAGAGETLVTSTVRDLVAGGEVAFADRGLHALRGVPGTWRLHAPVTVAAQDPAPAAATGRAEEPALPLPGRLTIASPVDFVGRSEAVETLAHEWAAVRDGRRCVTLLSGEPGIGKTRLATEVARAAHRDGAIVLYGTCQEDGGGAYSPVAQALGHLVGHAPQELLTEHVRRHGGVLVPLVPGLAARVPEASAPAPGDPETARFQLLAAMADLVVQASRVAPLVWVVDDLHWSDAPTRAALRHLVMSADPAPYLLLVTYRHTEVDEELADLLTGLGRQEDVTRTRLDGLRREEVEALVQPAAAEELDAGTQALARRLHDDTDGNPFFVVELLRDLADSGTVRRLAGGGYVLAGELSAVASPAGVREVVARRVAQLGEAAGRVLAHAAVIGREFDLEVLTAVTGSEEDDVIDLLDAAIAAGIVVELPGVADGFRFAHALGEQALYEGLSRTRRSRMHLRVAEALEALAGDEPGPQAPEIAHHHLAALPASDPGRARHWAMLAGRQAITGHAPQEAVRWFGHARELLDGALPAGERLDVLIALGEAQQRAGDAAYRQTLLEAGALALAHDDVDRLAASVFANARGRFSKVGEVDAERVAMLEETIVGLPERDPRRAQALAILAAERVWDGDLQPRIELSDEALEIADEAGDPVTLAHVLALRATAIWGPQTLPERLADAARLEALAEQLGDPTLRFWAAVWHGIALGQANDASGVERCLEVQRELAGICHQPALDMTRLLQESWWALVCGELEEAERLADEALKIGLEEAGDTDAPINHATQLVAIRLQQGRVADLREALEGGAQMFPGLVIARATLAVGRHADGDVDGARELLDAAAPLFAMPPIEPTTLAWMGLWAEVAVALEAAEHAEALLAWLDPARDQHLVQATASYGSVGRHAARLHALAGRMDVADERFTAATADLDALGAHGFAARTRAEHAELLARRDAPGDRERARALAEAAAAVAGEHGYGPAAELAAVVLSRLPAAPAVA